MERKRLLDTLGSYAFPELALAKEHGRRGRQHFRTGNASLKDLKTFGKGLQTFFAFQRWLCIVFLVLAVACSVPNMIFNSEGNDTTVGMYTMHISKFPSVRWGLTVEGPVSIVLQMTSS